MGEMQHRPAEKGVLPFGVCLGTGDTALLVVHLESPSFSPRALPGLFWGGNAALLFL